MLHRTKYLAHAALALMLAGSLSCPGGTTSVSEPAPTIVPPWWNQPIAFTLDARTVEHDAAFGLHIVRPVYHRASSTVLLEGYGYEGEQQLGLAGGGLIYRRDVGRHGSLEASAFFEGLRTTDGFSYPQFGAGLAFSPTRWMTLLANGYLPLRGKDSRPLGSDHWSETEGRGGSLREVDYWRDYRAERAPMRGFDLEVEFRLPDPPKWVDPRVAVGYAYRDSDERPEVYAGLVVRGELRFAKHFLAEAEWRQDAHGIDQEWRVGLRYQMLFGGPAGADETKSANLYAPVQRFPWPTVARGVSEGKAHRGETRALAPAQPQQADPEPADCCGGYNPPLIFN